MEGLVGDGQIQHTGQTEGAVALLEGAIGLEIPAVALEHQPHGLYQVGHLLSLGAGIGKLHGPAL